MLFNSAIFLFFFAVVFGVYCVALRSSPLRKAMRLVASYLFYAHWDWRCPSSSKARAGTSEASRSPIERPGDLKSTLACGYVSRWGEDVSQP
jgi:hypothetical protein